MPRLRKSGNIRKIKDCESDYKMIEYYYKYNFENFLSLIFN